MRLNNIFTVITVLIQLARRLNFNCRKDKEHGAITVAETLIALGVGATILTIVFAGIPAVVEARNTSAAVIGMTQIATAVRTTFGVRNNFTGLNTELARNLSGFPPNFRTETGAKHPWGGDVEINPGTNNKTFTVTFKTMNPSACVSLSTTTLDLADSVKIGSTEVDLSAPAARDDQPTSAANIAKLCKENTSGNVVWTFGG